MTDRPRGLQFSLAKLLGIVSLASACLALGRYFPISVAVGSGPVMAAAIAASALSRRTAVYAGAIACGLIWPAGAFALAMNSSVGDLEFFAPILVGCFAAGMLLGGTIGFAVYELARKPPGKRRRRRRRREPEWRLLD